MPDLAFTVESAAAEPFSATPELALALRVRNRPAGEAIHAVLLRCQVQIEAPRRPYSTSEAEALRDLFGAPARFAQTMRPLLWTHASTQIPAFTDESALPLPLPCSYDFALAAAKYLHALDDGDIPLALQFSGTIFYASSVGLQVTQIPTTCEARFRLPHAVWRAAMELHYPNWAPLALRKDVFDRLHRYKQRCELRTWEETVERLLARAEAS